MNNILHIVITMFLFYAVFFYVQIIICFGKTMSNPTILQMICSLPKTIHVDFPFFLFHVVF